MILFDALLKVIAYLCGSKFAVMLVYKRKKETYEL